MESYGYKKEELDIEVPIPRGVGYFPDRADIVIYRPSTNSRDPTKDILGIVETKRPHKKEGLAQLKSYMTATSAEWAVWTNGDDIAYLYGKTPNIIIDDYLSNIPIRGQSTEDVGRIDDKSDLKPFKRHELKGAFRRILRTLYANTNISRREKLGNEMIKILFAKITDEKIYSDRPPEFRAEAGEEPENIKKRIQELFVHARADLESDGILSPHEEITLDAKSLAWVVGQLERGSLLQTDSDIVGDAFEVFAESRFAGEKGEFFTPRGVVKIAVELASPNPEQTICDPACGSGGFLIHAMKYIWDAMEKSPKWRNSPRIKEDKKRIAAKSIFGIDKEVDLVKIAKAYMAISGDGRSNIVHENTLHEANDFAGAAKLYFTENGIFKQFDFIITNPSFWYQDKDHKR